MTRALDAGPRRTFAPRPPQGSAERRPARRGPLAPLRADLALALALAALTVALRLPGVTRPLVGVFATKNVVYAMIARNFARGDAGWRLPAVDVLVGGAPGLHLLEVPLSAYAAGLLWRTCGGSLDVWGRAVSIACSAAAVAWMFAAVRRRHSRQAAAMAAMVMASAPVSVIYGQCFMLEPSAALLAIAAYDAVGRWSDGGSRGWLIVGAAALAAAALTKIYLAVLLLPLLALATGGLDRWRAWWTAAALAASLAPAIAWCGYAWHVSAPGGPDAGRIYYSLRDSRQAHAWPSPRLAEAAFYMGAARDLSTLALTPIGAALALVGMAAAVDRRQIPLLAWLASMLLLVVLLPAKFQVMNYYWLVVLPPWAMAAGVGWETLLARWPATPALRVAVFASLPLIGLTLAARSAFVTPPEDRSVVAAAEAARRLAPRGRPIVASHGSCPDLLYYCDRRGWAIPADAPDFDAQLREAIDAGARLLVTCGQDEPRRNEPPPGLSAAPIEQGPGFAIWQLSPGKPPGGS